MVTIKTTFGDIKVKLFTDDAPKTVANFLSYVEDGFYNETIFHRVIDNFMIQCGGFNANFEQKETKATIKNEAANKISNKRGTLAMARTMEVDSASSQFFINLVDNKFLDYTGPMPQTFGYCVFAEVVEGMDVVDKIKSVKTATKGMHQDVPVENVTIIEVIND